MGGYGRGGYGEGGYGDDLTGGSSPPTPVALRLNVFPQLQKKPDVSIRQSYGDPTLRSKMENGLVFTRPRSSAIKRTWAVSYSYAPQTDIDALDDFIRNTVIGGSGSFSWADPRNGEEVTVRFAKLPEFQDCGWATQKDGVTSGQTFSFGFEVEEL